MENFVVAILYLVYFALKCMYFEDLLVESHFQDYKSFVTLITQLEIHEQGGNPVCWERKTAVCEFLKMRNTNDFLEIVKIQKNRPFLHPFVGGIFLFSSPEFILAGEICKKKHSIWSIWAPRAPFVISPPPIWGHHPVLDFHTQITRKSSTAMC